MVKFGLPDKPARWFQFGFPHNSARRWNDATPSLKLRPTSPNVFSQVFARKNALPDVHARLIIIIIYSQSAWSVSSSFHRVSFACVPWVSRCMRERSRGAHLIVIMHHRTKMHICSHICIFARIYAYMCAYMRIWSHRCISVRRNAYMRAYIHICTAHPMET